MADGRRAAWLPAGREPLGEGRLTTFVCKVSKLCCRGQAPAADACSFPCPAAPWPVAAASWTMVQNNHQVLLTKARLRDIIDIFAHGRSTRGGSGRCQQASMHSQQAPGCRAPMPKGSTYTHLQTAVSPGAAPAGARPPPASVARVGSGCPPARCRRRCCQHPARHCRL